MPVALVAARRWTALTACAGTALLLALAAWVTLGTDVWLGFLNAGRMMREVLDGADTWPRMLSTYAALRILHAGPGLAYASQAVISAACLASLARLTARRPGAGPEMAATACAAMLCTPYVLDYDLVCLAVPMAWLAGEAGRHGWQPWEKMVLLLLYLFPLLARPLNMPAGLPLAPPMILSLLLLVVARLRHGSHRLACAVSRVGLEPALL